MGRYTGPTCRLCRRAGQCLYLKGDRSLSDKCGIRRRDYPPGQHGARRGKVSEYGKQLREKQQMRQTYGLREKQFRNLFRKAERMKGVTGENLLVLLERRLDSIVYRLGFATTRAEARQLVNHGHFLVNGRKESIPSSLVRPGDVIELRERSRKIPRINENLEAAPRRGLASWVELDRTNFRGEVKALPQRQEMTSPAFEEHLVVELYSK
ncbi:MAG: 30S ribosomal protein S4 [Syntrophotaleaceae bacterium]